MIRLVVLIEHGLWRTDTEP